MFALSGVVLVSGYALGPAPINLNMRYSDICMSAASPLKVCAFRNKPSSHVLHSTRLPRARSISGASAVACTET
jgi:hypothetical protein